MGDSFSPSCNLSASHLLSLPLSCTPVVLNGVPVLLKLIEYPHN